MAAYSIIYDSRRFVRSDSPDTTILLPLVAGGTNAGLTADNGAIAYSSATALALLASTATAGKLLRSGASAAPTWSTSTFPAAAGAAGHVPRSDGTNYVDASLAAADLSNGTTGTGSIVLATSPSVTGINVTDGILQVKGMQIQSFALIITNTAGTLQHAIAVDPANISTAATFANKVTGASTTLANTPSLDSTHDFVSGGGVEAAATNNFHLNTAAQVQADFIGLAVIAYDNLALLTGAETRVIASTRSINVNGTTRNRIMLTFYDTAGNPYALTVANIAAGTGVRAAFMGFIT